MAITFVGSKTDSKVGSTTARTIMDISSGLTGGSDAGVSAGDLVIAIFATGSTANRGLEIRGSANTVDYTLIGSELYSNDTFDSNLRVAYRRMPATPDANVNFGATLNAADAGAMMVMVYRGVDDTTPLDGVTPTTATGTNGSAVDPPSITPSTSGAWIFMAGSAGHANGQVTFSSAPGYLSNFTTVGGANDTNDVSLGAGHYTSWTSGAYNGAAWTAPTGTNVNSSSWAALCAVLRPAPTLSLARNHGYIIE